jgi:predicted enzyme related to lactoylglutathione lyase
MAVTLGYVTIDCADARALARFWASALGWEVTYEADDGALLVDPAGISPRLFLQVVPEPKAGKNRAHVDLVADDYASELDRLTGLGASTVATNRTPDGKPSAVLADPQGNEFCLA